jgi:hypothetical protein
LGFFYERKEIGTVEMSATEHVTLNKEGMENEKNYVIMRLIMK